MVTISDTDSGRPMTAARFVLCLLAVGAASTTVATQTDLDGFMQQVLARRDDNWQKLQQYILDEREAIELRGPGGVSLWGERREYTWYVRDGFFVRSPIKVNGAPISDGDRRKYEADFIARAERRERRAGDRPEDRGPASTSPPTAAEAPRDLDGLLRQTQQPQFISSAYFLRFKFDEGRYALVGRERLENQDVLRIEYYPTNLFRENERRQRARERGAPTTAEREDRRGVEEQMMWLMNKASKVTLWVEPASHQILKYTFDDLGWNFFPGQWLMQMDTLTASMTMAEAFPSVWLPRGLDMHIALTTALGPANFAYTLEYFDYRQPDVTTRIGVPGDR
jgi:hypothetical protein